ncbi:MAG TPA: hypothetical protein ENJ30_07320 [Desulfobulbaceae bacterium]|nr:hypothetical protein [Desulfobulbaceae bacterium]
MAVFNKFDVFSEDLASAKHNLDGSTHSLKLLLTNTAPVASNAVLADLTEIAAGNGYNAGGLALSYTRARSGNVTKITCADTSLTASGGTIGPYRYAVLYNATAANGPLIGWWDRGAAKTIEDAGTENFDFDDVNGAFTIS